MPKKPRQTGSMVAHHDDVVTRMKNIELIEIGKHRIRPWYFSPYPLVRNRGTSLLTLIMARNFSLCGTENPNIASLDHTHV
jgi:hypothetical protein